MKTFAVAIAVAVAVEGGGLVLIARPAAPGQTTQQTAKPAPAKTAISPDELDRLLAPIALYPDQLLAEMLLCAGNPGKVAALNEWLASQTAKGTELQDAAAKSGFEPSFVALVLFPDVVSHMATQMDRTARLGEAFAADRSAVFASIQRLRAKAKNAGTLKTTPQQEVETRKTSSGEQVIVIEPSNPQVVYVPQYDAQTVYTQQTSTSTVIVQKDSTSTEEAVAAGLIGFTAGVAIGAAMDNSYYYGPYGWYGGAYMYNDAWDDWYDDREDMREDWYENREDLAEERSERARDAQENRQENRPEAQQERTERQQNRQENRPEAQANREQRRTDAQAKASQATSAGTSSYESRGYSGSREQTAKDRSGTRSDAFSNYSSGKSERAASQRGQRSRSSSRSGGSRRR
jgi:hypothetical protein